MMIKAEKPERKMDCVWYIKELVPVFPEVFGTPKQVNDCGTIHAPTPEKEQKQKKAVDLVAEELMRRTVYHKENPAPAATGNGDK